MYPLSPLQPLDARPWDVPFEVRLSQLYQAFLQRKRSVVYLYEKPDTSTFRYRAYNMCQVLKRSLRWNGVFFFADELERLTAYLDWVWLVIIIRFRWGPALDRFLQALQRHKIPAVFDVDDFVFDPRYLPLITSVLNVDLEWRPGVDHADMVDYWAAYLARLQLTACACQSFITTNSFIGARLERSFHKPVQIIPNFLNEEQAAVSRQIWAAKQGQRPVPPFMLGYFSGTPSHVHDFRVVAPELQELMEKYADISLTIVGFMEVPASLSKLQAQGRLLHEPLQDFCELQRRIGQVDVNLIPLAESEFTNCKSELKYFEAAIVGAISCASPTFVYQRLIKHGQNGFLCRPGEWRLTVEKIYRGEFDPALTHSARELSLREFGAEAQLPRIESVLDHVAAGG